MTTPVLRLLIARVCGLFGGRDEPGFRQRDAGTPGPAHGAIRPPGHDPRRGRAGRTPSVRQHHWLQEDRRDMRTIPTSSHSGIDVRQRCAPSGSNPTFAAAVVLTLALGIGANTAIFSICNAVLLAPLPYADAGRIVMLWELMGPGSHCRLGGELRRLAPAVALLRRHGGDQPVLELRPHRQRRAGTSQRRAPFRWTSFRSSARRSALGRGFLLEEDQPDRNRVVILAHALWVERFGRRADILGKHRHAQRHQLYRRRRAAAGVRARGQGVRLPDANPVRCLGAVGTQRDAVPRLAPAARLCPAEAGRRPWSRRRPRSTRSAHNSPRRIPKKTRGRGSVPCRCVSRRPPTFGAPCSPCSPPWVSCWPLPAPTSRT